MKPTHLTLFRRARPGLLTILGVAAGWAFAEVRAAEPQAPPDYASFRMVIERNIFNASRSGRRTEAPRETPAPARVDAFALVGIMSYEKGPFAFFDGSGSEYRKALQPGGTIAGFELAEILSHAVTLRCGTNSNTTELRLGMQLRREEAGEWQIGERTESFESTGSDNRSRSRPMVSSNSSSSPAETPSTTGSNADAEEVLKRLLKKREEENQ